MAKLTRSEVVEVIEEGFGNVFGDKFKTGKSMEVDPVVVQRTEERLRQDYAFLNMVDTQYTDDASAEIIFVDEGQSIAQRSGNTRRPVDITNSDSRKFDNVEVEFDALIPWKKVDQWGMNAQAILQSYQNYVIRSRAMSRLRVGFYGQSQNLAVDSDRTTYQMMEDVKKGWLQYIIENAPSQVFGITIDALDPKGYTVDAVKVGEGGDFPSVLALVNYLRNTKIDRIYRNKTTLQAIAGNELVNTDIQKIINAAGNTATERMASESLLALSSIGKLPAVTPDEMPERGLIISDPKNLIITIQNGTVRRKFEEDPKQKGLVDYLTMNMDFVIGALEGVVAVHPDAIQMKNAAGNWVAAADVWAIDPVV